MWFDILVRIVQASFTFFYGEFLCAQVQLYPPSSPCSHLYRRCTTAVSTEILEKVVYNILRVYTSLHTLCKWCYEASNLTKYGHLYTTIYRYGGHMQLRILA